jgi:hypothetical protein
MTVFCQLSLVLHGVAGIGVEGVEDSRFVSRARTYIETMVTTLYTLYTIACNQLTYLSIIQLSGFRVYANTDPIDPTIGGFLLKPRCAHNVGKLDRAHRESGIDLEGFMQK